MVTKLGVLALQDSDVLLRRLAPSSGMRREELVEGERIKDLRAWLTRHNTSPEVLQRHANYRQQEQVLKHLQKGVEQEEDPQRELDVALHFAGSTSGAPLPRGYRHDKSLQRSERFNTAIQRLQDYDGKGAADSRWKSGLNAITLLTEYRRKIIFAAMLDTKEIVNEDRASARQKLDSYLSEYAPELLDLSSVEPGENPTSPEPMKMVQKSIKIRPTKKQEQQKKEQPAFEPKFGEYEVMKNRWRYILPQTRRLVSPTEAVVPRSTEKLVIIKNTTVRGTANEAMDFMKRKSQHQH